MKKIKLVKNEALSAEDTAAVKDIANYLKGVQPEKVTATNAFGNPTSITFPKWYSDTKKLLFPFPYYYRNDLEKIVKAGNDYITQKYGKGAYVLSMEKVYSAGYHCDCYVIRIKPAKKENASEAADGAVIAHANEGNSGSLEINSGYDAYYELKNATILLEVSMKLSDNAVGASGSITVVTPFTNEKISIALQNAALKAMDYYIQKDLKTPAYDNGASTKKVRYEVDLATHKLSYERDFDSAAANILRELGED
jgi:hypothetical protein